MRLVKLVLTLNIAISLVGMLSQAAWPQNGASAYSGISGLDTKAAKSDKAPLVTTSLGNNIHLLSGDGANVVAISDDRSVLLIDSGTADRVTELAQHIYQLAQRPVTTVVNTDCHPDHAGGNAYFSSFGVTIIAQTSTRERIAAQYRAALKSYAANNHSSFKVAVSPWSAAVESEASQKYAVRGIPTVAFNDSLTIDIDTEELHFFHFGVAHTDGDTVVLFEKANIIVLGEIFPGNRYPWIDFASAGSLPGLIETLDRVLRISDEKTRIVPAQGAVVHKAELQRYRDMLTTIQHRIKALLESGATASDVLAAAPTSSFDREWGGGLVSGEMFTRLAVESIVRRP